jgi:acyl carrier protein
MTGTVTEILRNFVVQNFLFGDLTRPLGDDDSFLEKGIVDSTGILEMVGFLEKELGLKVQDEEIVPDHFDSIARLARYIHRKQGDS